MIAFFKRIVPSLLIIATATFVTIFVASQAPLVHANVSMSVLSSTDMNVVEFSDPNPDTPSVISPSDQLITNDQTVLFAWNSAGENMTYELMYSFDNNFSAPQTVTSADTSVYITLAVTQSLPLYWKIRTLGANGEVSAWTSIHSFSFNVPPVLIRSGRCNGNCANCQNPCGRRPAPVDY